MRRLDKTIVREFLRYEPSTGKLYWKKRDRKWFTTDHQCNAWNGRMAEKEAFTAIDGNGYPHGSIFNKKYYAHRIIWLWMTGRWPDPEIDHQNHNRSDNRWLNLCEETNQCQNLTLSKRNTSGQMGVHWFKRTRQWTAYIGSRPRTSLGYYNSFDEAVAARKAAEIKLGYHPNHGAVGR